FRRLVNLVPRRGLLVVGAASPVALEVSRGGFCRVESFAVEGTADWQAKSVRVDVSGSRFEVWRERDRFAEMTGPFWGPAALSNALAVVAAAHHLGLSADEIA